MHVSLAPSSVCITFPYPSFSGSERKADVSCKTMRSWLSAGDGGMVGGEMDITGPQLVNNVVISVCFTACNIFISFGVYKKKNK